MIMLNLLAEAANPLEHVLKHELIHGFPVVTNQMVMALIAGILMLFIFPSLFRSAEPAAPSGAKNFFESILEFLRIEVFRPALKEHTLKFLPFLWTLFFFILFCNVLGAIPFGSIFTLIFGAHSPLSHLGGTATGNLSTTAALAICAFFVIHANGVMQVYHALRDGTYGHHAHHEEHTADGSKGHETAHDLDHMRGDALAADIPGDFRAIGNPTAHYADDQHVKRTTSAPAHDDEEGHGHGESAGNAALKAFPLYLWNFAPHPFKPAPGSGAVKWLPDIFMWAFLLILELLGAVIKPFSLSIRLFANMIAGHIVLAALVGLIGLAPTIAGQIGIGIPVTLLSVGISILELFVAFLQAYIFTFLVTLFIASAVAPEH